MRLLTAWRMGRPMLYNTLTKCTGLRNGKSSSLKCLGRTLLPFRRPVSRVSKNGRIKLFHSYQKEWIHKTSYSGPKTIIKSMKKNIIYNYIDICHLHNKIFISAKIGTKIFGKKWRKMVIFGQIVLCENWLKSEFIMKIEYGNNNIFYTFFFQLFTVFASSLLIKSYLVRSL